MSYTLSHDDLRKLLEDCWKDAIGWYINGLDIKDMATYITSKLSEMSEGEDEADGFAISFAAWVIGSEGEMYRASGVSASKLLQIYKNRPYIDTHNPQNQ